MDEITNFFGVLAGREQFCGSFEKDKEAIALIERIEGAGMDVLFVGVGQHHRAFEKPE